MPITSRSTGKASKCAREGIEPSVSTMADHVGAYAATLMPLHELIKPHVFAPVRVHGDDTTVPALAEVKTRTGRILTYVRDVSSTTVFLSNNATERHPSGIALGRKSWLFGGPHGVGEQAAVGSC